MFENDTRNPANYSFNKKKITEEHKNITKKMNYRPNISISLLVQVSFVICKAPVNCLEK